MAQMIRQWVDEDQKQYARQKEQEAARDDVAGRMRDLLIELAVNGCGATRREDPIEGFQLLTHTRLEPETAGIQAAKLLGDVSERLIRTWAENARATGYSWDAIGEALGLLAEGQTFNRAEAAFDFVAGERPLPVNGISVRRMRIVQPEVRYRCGTCDRMATDRGPWEGNPEEELSGHREDCTLYADLYRAWRARVADDR
jgi:hypothetical protein